MTDEERNKRVSDAIINASFGDDGSEQWLLNYVASLEQALKPFAEYSERFGDAADGTDCGLRFGITVGDCRNAAKALEGTV